MEGGGMGLARMRHYQEDSAEPERTRIFGALATLARGKRMRGCDRREEVLYLTELRSKR